MDIRNASDWSAYSSDQKLVGSLGLILLSVVLHWLLNPWADGVDFFYLFATVGLVSTYGFGYRWGLFTALAGFMACQWLLKPSVYVFDGISPHEWWALGDFALVGLSAIVLIERLQRLRYHQSLVMKVMNSRHQAMLYMDNLRQHQAREHQRIKADMDALRMTVGQGEKTQLH
ncbi:DUF4118 domain-containing protein [Limnobacter humi]|uniref:DUF4118 domain-containing protein n=1 Tax=Limnobacter humi TaxID=1778671 RepID=A0ABT1WCR7_9BURK|nr:DUF4118 domain-containing protein [Limnobacter humi]MCQ8895295.1 DUF4118 domain-containing protein [Limnobacter humi]